MSCIDVASELGVKVVTMELLYSSVDVQSRLATELGIKAPTQWVV